VCASKNPTAKTFHKFVAAFDHLPHKKMNDAEQMAKAAYAALHPTPELIQMLLQHGVPIDVGKNEDGKSVYVKKDHTGKLVLNEHED